MAANQTWAPAIATITTLYLEIRYGGLNTPERRARLERAVRRFQP